MAGKGRPFRKGQPGGPGRPTGGVGGRRLALIRLDEMLAVAGNLEALVADWQRLFEKNPAGFFQRVVVPLMPKGTTFDFQDGNGISRLIVEFQDVPENGKQDG